MFSDFKSRGFGLEQTHIQYPDRLARLILVMSLALYWAVSTGIWDQVNNPAPAEKKTGTSARQARTGTALLVHARHPPRHKTPPQMPPAPETLGMPIKLMDPQTLQERMRDDFNIAIKQARTEVLARMADLDNPELSTKERLTQARWIVRSFERRRAKDRDFPASPEVRKSVSIINKHNYQKAKARKAKLAM